MARRYTYPPTYHYEVQNVRSSWVDCRLPKANRPKNEPYVFRLKFGQLDNMQRAYEDSKYMTSKPKVGASITTMGQAFSKAKTSKPKPKVGAKITMIDTMEQTSKTDDFDYEKCMKFLEV